MTFSLQFPRFLNFASSSHPSFLSKLCTTLSAATPRLRHVWWSLHALFHSRASCTSGTDSSAADPWSLQAPFFLSHLKLVCSRSATLEPGDCTAASQEPGISMFWTFRGSHLASSGSSALVFASVLPSRCSDVWRYSDVVSLLARQRSCAVALKLQ